MSTGGDIDIARVAALFADPARVRVLTALSDGRALAASVLAGEAGLSPQGVSSHLAKLRQAGMVTVETSGRHRFYRLTGEEVAQVLETLARFAPLQPVTSLKAGTRAEALRFARTCYDHVAGRLGVAVTSALLERGALISTDGIGSTVRRAGDRLSAPLRTQPYRLGPDAARAFAELGVDVEAAAVTRRPLLKFCLDWSEQQHHLAGALGAAMSTEFHRAGWVRRRQPGRRSLRLTDLGRAKLRASLGVTI